MAQWQQPKKDAHPFWVTVVLTADCGEYKNGTYVLAILPYFEYLDKKQLILTYLWSNLEILNAFVKISYLYKMLNNKKAQHICQQVGKHPCKIQSIVKTYAVHENTLENSKLGYEYVRINYSPKNSKYAVRLLIDVSFLIFTMVCCDWLL